MLQGWQIFKHAIAMLWSNKREVLQIALVPILIATVLIVGTTTVFSDLSMMNDHMFSSDPFAPAPEVPVDMLGSFFAGLAFFIVISIVVSIWVIVSWHRFILLEEAPTGWMPAFNRDRLLAYFVQLLKLIGLGILVAIPFVLLFAALGAAGSGPAVFVIAGVIMGVAITILFMRWALILPAAAIAKPLSLRGAWDATEGAFVALIVTVILVTVLQFGLQLVAGSLSALSPILGFAVSLVVSFVVGMLNASILTTLYGHYVEGRDL